MAPNSISRRTLAIATGAFLLAGCAGTTEPQKPQSQGPLLTIIAEQGATLARNFNPFAATSRWATRNALYEPLMIWNHVTGTLEPSLATGHTWSADNKTLTLTLREGVTWSDGTPFGSADVLFTLELMRTHKGLVGEAATPLAQYVDTITAPDAKTVVIALREAITPALYDLVSQRIVPKHIWEKVADPVTETNQNPVGTGPFVLSTFRPQGYELKRNDKYWQKVEIPGLRLSGYTGQDQINAAVLSGQIDWGAVVPDPDKTFVAKDPANHHYWWPRTADVNLVVNTTLKPFDDPAVRKAFSMALDRARMVDIALWGKSDVANAVGLPSQAYPGWLDESVLAEGKKTVTLDLAAANAALDAAGFAKGADGKRTTPDGKPAAWDLIVPTGWTDWISVAGIVSSSLAQAGITANVKTVGFDNWSSTVYGGKFQLTLGAGKRGATPYGYFRDMLSTATVKPVGEVSTNNFHRYGNAEADKLLTAFAATSDEAEQKRIAADLQRIYVAELPTIPLYEQPDWGAFVTKRYTGFPSADNAYAPLANDPLFPTTYLVYPKLKAAR
ncbi:ABC transporter substrate-binding protein [Nonomuraea soli]|uniref:Peptide/nickel transport system substrate-binding protein n=1 Tax=Nonomuraea soli TaxID=1032476 RepID=A0A7W0HT45_9ACTN|nr:ABC transporter substrate-binding protein [Nonomuraea soli]MBA2894592.1 peptide/nickel transport system substrate-binding protein [Nonomuraea soli]